MDHDDQPDRVTLVLRLDDVRHELDRLAAARALSPFNDEEQARYRELCDEECRLLDALAPGPEDAPTE